MKLTDEQLIELAHKMNFLIGQKVKYQNEENTIGAIEIMNEQNTIRFLLKDGLPHQVLFYVWLDEFIEYNPEYSHLLPS